MRNEFQADYASPPAVDDGEGRSVAGRKPDPGAAAQGPRASHRVALERAHRSVGPQGEAPLGAPRSGSA